MTGEIDSPPQPIQGSDPAARSPPTGDRPRAILCFRVSRNSPARLNGCRPNSRRTFGFSDFASSYLFLRSLPQASRSSFAAPRAQKRSPAAASLYLRPRLSHSAIQFPCFEHRAWISAVPNSDRSRIPSRLREMSSCRPPDGILPPLSRPLRVHSGFFWRGRIDPAPFSCHHSAPLVAGYNWKNPDVYHREKAEGIFSYLPWVGVVRNSSVRPFVLPTLPLAKHRLPFRDRQELPPSSRRGRPNLSPHDSVPDLPLGHSSNRSDSS